MNTPEVIDQLGERLVGREGVIQAKRWLEDRDRRMVQSKRRLRGWHNRHAGKRCFILGNGPSLNRTDLSLLKDEFTFGVNRIYLKEGFSPSFYVCANELVVEQFAADIKRLPCPKFISWHSREKIDFTPDMAFMRTRHGLRSWFFTDVSQGCWEGSTVTMVCLQLAFHMGFSEVVLIGVDHSYAYQGNSHAEQQFVGDDPNHFDPTYFKGHRWHTPDLEGSELSYRVAKWVFEQSGRRVLDATIGGKLQIFPKVAYESLFDRPAAQAA